MSNTRKISTFVPKQDNANIKISSNDINELQNAINVLQQDSFMQADDIFLKASLSILENEDGVNAMMLDTLETDDDLATLKLKNAVHIPEIASVLLKDDKQEAIIETALMPTATGKPINGALLMADYFIPDNGSIECSISFDGITYTLVQLDKLEKTKTTSSQVSVRFVLKGKGARLDAWSFLYEDSTYSYRFLDDGLTIDFMSSWDGTIVE